MFEVVTAGPTSVVTPLKYISFVDKIDVNKHDRSSVSC